MASTPTNDSVSQLLGELERNLHTTTGVVGADLERIRGVVRDATAKLGHSFRGLQDVLEEHRQVLQTMMVALHDTENGTTGFTRSADAMTRQFVEEMVRVGRDSMRIIDDLATLSKNIDGVVSCADGIDKLARETRFIAFNARIETHRAGDSGRTFKVVADEVKRLADASSTLSAQIRGSISLSRQHVSSLSKTAEGLASHDMGTAIASHKALSGAVGKLDEVNQSINGMLERVAENLASAVRALQFEDMVSQLVTGNQRRVESLSKLMVRAVWALETGQPGERARTLREIVAAMEALTANGTVQQSSMATGAIELF